MYWWASSRAGACNLPEGGGAAIYHRPFHTLPYQSRRRTRWREIVSRISAGPATITVRCCAQGPERPHANRTAVHGSFAVGRPLAAGMKRHRPGTTVYLERRATGSLADLHLHLHAGPLPVGRWLAVLAQLVYGRR